MAVISESQVLNVTNRLTAIVTVCCFVIVCLAAVVGTIVVNKIANPIKKVTQGAREIAGGNFEVTLKLNSSGEIAQLVEAFNQIGITLFNYKNYIIEITSVLDQIADGKLCFALEQEYVGEFGRIKEALLNISEH